MSIKLMTAIWDRAEDFDLSGIETAILVKLADFAADDGSSVYPSLERLVKATRFSESTIKRSLKSLRSRNFIVKVADHSAKMHLANVYKINSSIFYECLSRVHTDQRSERPEVTVTPGRVQTDPRAGFTQTPTRGQSDLLTIIEPLLITTNELLLEISPISSQKQLSDFSENTAFQESISEDSPNKPFLEKKAKSHPRKKTTIPEDLTLSEEWRQAAVAKGLHPDWVEDEFETFTRTFIEKGSRKSRWDWTWQKWVQNAIGYAPGKMKNKPRLSLVAASREPQQKSQKVIEFEKLLASTSF